MLYILRPTFSVGKVGIVIHFNDAASGKIHTGVVEV